MWQKPQRKLLKWVTHFWCDAHHWKRVKQFIFQTLLQYSCVVWLQFLVYVVSLFNCFKFIFCKFKFSVSLNETRDTSLKRLSKHDSVCVFGIFHTFKTGDLQLNTVPLRHLCRHRWSCCFKCGCLYFAQTLGLRWCNLLQSNRYVQPEMPKMT